jgi:AmiR/NasT family two-component response regulator
MADDSTLRVLIADERSEIMDRLAGLVRQAGHVPVACEAGVADTAAAVEREAPDVAVVGVHDNPRHALDLLDALTAAGDLPIIAALDSEDDDFIADAAERGVVAHAALFDAETLAAALRLARTRSRQLGTLAERVRRLQERMGSRAALERAKGVLMERHDIAEPEAYELLRRRAREERRPITEIADAVLSARRLLPRRPGAPDGH